MRGQIPFAQEQWDRIQQLFLAVADLPDDLRSAYLDQHCLQDSALRQRVEKLLRAEAKAAAGVAEAIRSEARALFAASDLSGTRLGSYRLVRPIGQGGMGAVYLATRDDDQFEKQVAIKVVKRGMDTDEVLRRFRHERQILANLEHPYIARLIDGGSTEDGRPFLVMEFVEGESLGRFAVKLSIRERCLLFLKVCEAVSHAHRNLVVHRDLKPGNILITADGSPKLLDFGVARILDPQMDPGLTIHSENGRPLTPDYASPEQIRGDTAGTGADVYSLGVVFHELLTGIRPRVTASFVDTPVDAPRESLGGVAGAERLRHKLQGDLDNIVQKATRIEPERRYASVDQFAEDIRNYLESRPVLARPDSLWYRTAKFARRRRYPLLATAAVAISLICGIVIALSQARHARNAQARAEDRLAQMVSVSNRSLTNVYTLLERLPGAMPARKELVHSTVDLLQDLSREAGNDSRVRIALARAYLKLGDLQGDQDAANIGDVPGSLKSYQAGTALISPLTSEPDSERLALWADLQNGIGKLLTATGERDRAAKILDAAIAVVDRSDDATSKAELYLSMARALDATKVEPALEWGKKSVEAAKLARQRTPNDTRVLLILSAAYTTVGYAYFQAGHPEGAEIPYAESMRLREQLAREHPNDFVFRRYLKLAYEHYAALQGSPQRANLGHPEIARLYYKKAQPLEEADRDDPQNHSAKYDYAYYLLSVAIVDVPPEGLAESLATLRRVNTMIESLVAEATGVDRYEASLVLAYQFTARRLLQLGRSAEAADEYRRTANLARKLLLQAPGDIALERRLKDAEVGTRQALAATSSNRKDRVEEAARTANPGPVQH
jgi:eukaryotic-like serine/threonine-protein kinase